MVVRGQTRALIGGGGGGDDYLYISRIILIYYCKCCNLIGYILYSLSIPR